MLKITRKYVPSEKNMNQCIQAVCFAGILLWHASCFGTAKFYLLELEVLKFHTCFSIEINLHFERSVVLMGVLTPITHVIANKLHIDANAPN